MRRKSEYHTRGFKKCPFCERCCKRFIDSNGVNKGYLKSCGAVGCRAYNRNRVCKHCGLIYLSKSPRRQWCYTCVPDSSSKRRICKYGISYLEFKEILSAQGGSCGICGSPNATELDHDHTTNAIRGVLCIRCNLLLGRLEDREWIKMAEVYLASNKSEATKIIRDSRAQSLHSSRRE